MNFDHFSIRLLTLNDTEEFFRLIDQNRPRLEAFFSGTVARTRTAEDTKTYVEEIVRNAELRIYLPFLLVNNLDQAFIGFMDIKNIDWNIPKGELGCFMDEKYANQGIFTKAFQCFTAYCFDHYRFNKLFLRTHENNHAARKVAEHCGFEIEGTIRRDYKTTDGKLVDLLYYGRLSAPLS